MQLDENLKKLNDLVLKVEKDDISLDESVKAFEEGSKIAKLCLKDLKEVKGKITILKQDIDKYKEEEMEI